MKTIKWLWSITIAFMTVLLYATATSLFVTPNSEWYLALNRPISVVPTPTLITIGWAINYILTIIILTKLIFKHDNRRAIAYIVVIGIMQIIWSIIFFSAHSLLGGLIIEILILAVSLVAISSICDDDLIITVLFSIVTLWYIITTIAGYNIWLVNT